MRSTIVAFYLFVFPIFKGGRASNFSCYHCNSIDSPECRDPFSNDKIFLKPCQFACQKIKDKDNFKVVRRCAPASVRYTRTRQACVTQYIPLKGDKTVCYCTRNACNDGQRFALDYPLLFLVSCITLYDQLSYFCL